MEKDSRMKELLWSGVRHAIDAAGGTKAGLAKAMGVTPGAITQWCKRGRIPVERAAKVEDVLGVPRETTRPDIFERGDVA